MNLEAKRKVDTEQAQRLRGKTCVITGAAAGIGYATAIKFLNEGAQVILCDQNSSALSTAIQTLGSPRAVAKTMDVRHRDGVRAALGEVLKEHGTIDVLVNNAGITRDGKLAHISDEEFDLVVDVNLKGVFNCTQAAISGMLPKGRGVILNASSVVGLHGNFGQTNYAATKFGVIGMTKTWARELGPKGIRVNAVCPGFIATEILNSVPGKVLDRFAESCWTRRLGRPEEVANVYAFLASDEASFVNGAVLEVSGGLSI